MPLKWTPPRLPDKRTATYENTADHALIVHDGALLNNGGIIPAREFMLGAFQAIGPTSPPDYAEIFADRFQRSGNFSDAWRTTANRGRTEINRNIRSRIWPWPNETRRRNGKTVFTPRDIVDTGDLQRSQQAVRFS